MTVAMDGAHHHRQMVGNSFRGRDHEYDGHMNLRNIWSRRNQGIREFEEVSNLCPRDKLLNFYHHILLHWQSICPRITL